MSTENAGSKWTFAGAFDDYLLLFIDGKQVLAPAQCALGTGMTEDELTEGWHTFRVFVYDISGGDGPSSTWKTSGMSLGFHVGETYSQAVSDYTKFDTNTLRMRPIQHEGVVWQKAANPSSTAPIVDGRRRMRGRVAV